MVDPLSFRLPVGIRDLTPDAAAARRRVAECLIVEFEKWGYAQVITPAFEYENVLARGLGSVGRGATLRFVEPSSGQVLALRPDITPQIARLVATRFAAHASPLRLSYEGTVFRHDPGQRSQREVMQAGVELAGVAGPSGEQEAVTLAVSALAAVGLKDPTIDLGHLGLSREVIDGLKLPAPLLPRFRTCVRRRDGAGVAGMMKDAAGSRSIQAFARLLPTLAGKPSVIAQALDKAPTAGIRDALKGLADVVSALESADLRARIHVDLSEVRGFDYYTGVRFQVFAHGAARAVGGGGRYDQLIGRYGEARPAVGFAIDVEAAATALEAQGGARYDSPTERDGILVVGRPEAAALEAARLRRKGHRCAVFPAAQNERSSSVALRKRAESYAEQWGFAKVVTVTAAGSKTRR